MVRLEEWMEIKRLHQEGHSIRDIARVTGRARNTVRKVIRQKAPELFKKAKRTSQLDPMKDYIRARYESCRLSAVRVLEEIRLMGYVGSLRTLRRYMQGLRRNKLMMDKLTVRFETAPGKQAQVDWAHCGAFEDPREGKKVKLYVFVMILGFSRMMFVKFTLNMNIQVLIRCHMEAFEFLGGWTQSILYDNMKQVRVDQGQWNPLFLDFANHYGFIPKTCKPYRARTKGKVERMVNYLKDNFLTGRSFVGLDELNARALHWLNTVANVRVHSSTDEKPCDRWGRENLTSLKSAPVYRVAQKHSRKVDSEGRVRFDRSRYSVPPRFTGQEVLIEHEEQRILIKKGDIILAEHALATRPGSCVTRKEHVQELWKLSLNRKESPPPYRWNVSFTNEVAQTPLHHYEEVVR